MTQILESPPMKMIYRKLPKTASLSVTCHPDLLSAVAKLNSLHRLLSESCHYVAIDILPFSKGMLGQRALDVKAKFLIEPDGSRIVRVNLKFEPGQV
jgi:hypothetical protein